MLGPSVERKYRKEHGGADSCVEEGSTFDLSGSHFLLDKTVVNFEADGWQRGGTAVC